MDKLERYLSGIKEMPKLPGVIYIVDLKKERIALQEGRKLEIPVVAIVDTNCDPDEIDYPVPGNDDAIRAIKLITNKVADAILEVRQIETEGEEEVEAEEGEEEKPEGVEAIADEDVVMTSAEKEAGEAETDAVTEAEDAEDIAKKLGVEAAETEAEEETATEAEKEAKADAEESAGEED